MYEFLKGLPRAATQRGASFSSDQYFKDIKVKQFLGKEEIFSPRRKFEVSLDPVGPCRFQNEASQDL